MKTTASLNEKESRAVDPKNRLIFVSGIMVCAVFALYGAVHLGSRVSINSEPGRDLPSGTRVVLTDSASIEDAGTEGLKSGIDDQPVVLDIRAMDRTLRQTKYTLDMMWSLQTPASSKEYIERVDVLAEHLDSVKRQLRESVNETITARELFERHDITELPVTITVK